MTDQQTDLQKLDDALSGFEDFLAGQTNPDGTQGPTLRENWISLQVFSQYGLRLPSTPATLQNMLGLTHEQTLAYEWFDAMVESYAGVKDSSHYFMTRVFVDMTDLGTSLQGYASTVVGENSAFGAVLALVEAGDQESLQGALSIVQLLRDMSDKNAALARTIKTGLAEYKGQLIEAGKGVTDVQDQIRKDDRVNQATIERLGGGPDVDGSVAQIQSLIDADWGAYHHDVTVAATSVTYAWIEPAGTIAAAVVAGIYGDKATKMLRAIHRLEGELKTARRELQTAVAVQRTSKIANTSLTDVHRHLDFATNKANAVQNAWLGLKGGLDDIDAQVSHSLTVDAGGRERLSAIAAVKFFMRRAQDDWATLKPRIDEMVTDPMITVSSDDVSIDDVIAKIEAAEKEHGSETPAAVPA